MFDAIVLATGYRPTYRAFLDGIAAERPSGIEEPTLHFVGFQTKVTGLLREISREAKAVAQVIGRGNRR